MPTVRDVIFASIAAGGIDLHLKAGADALNAGLDLSATRLFSDDIDGQSEQILEILFQRHKIEKVTPRLKSDQEIHVTG